MVRHGVAGRSVPRSGNPRSFQKDSLSSTGFRHRGFMLDSGLPIGQQAQCIGPCLIGLGRGNGKRQGSRQQWARIQYLVHSACYPQYPIPLFHRFCACTKRPVRQPRHAASRPEQRAAQSHSAHFSLESDNKYIRIQLKLQLRSRAPG